MKTLYLHIGTPKTGSTSIQKFLCANREVLKKHGYCYPVIPIYYQRMGRARNALFLQGLIYDENGKRDKEKEQQNLKKGMEYLRAEFKKHRNIIMSDEVLWLALYRRRASLWEELLEATGKNGYQLKAVVYLRRQDQYISSWWNQMLKKRRILMTMTWEEYRYHFPENLWPDYDEALTRIAGAIGRENIIVRVFERGRFYNGSLEADFLNAVGLELTPDFVVQEEQSNPKLAGNVHEIKRILNTLPKIRFREDDFFREVALGFTAQSGDDYPTTVLPAKDAAEFLEPYLEGNRRIAKEYFGEDSDLFNMKFSDMPRWEKDNPHMLDDVVRLVGTTSRKLLKMYDDQSRELDELEKTRKELEKRLKKLEG